MPDFVLYRAYYCGLCKATGRLFGQLPRITTNYDVTFLCLFLHEILAVEPQFESSGCILNPIRKKLTVCSNELLDKIACVNIILSYHKLSDAILDKEGMGKKTAQRLIKRAYNKAVQLYPNIDKMVKDSYKNLVEAEKQNTAGIDRVSHHFAALLSDIAREVLMDRATEDILKLCYNVGKFVYLADALDDVDEDFKKGRYNPFLAVYPTFTTRKEYFEHYKEELSFAINSTINRAIECSNRIYFDLNTGLVYNIIHKGLRAKARELFDSDKKLKKPKI